MLPLLVLKKVTIGKILAAEVCWRLFTNTKSWTLKMSPKSQLKLLQIQRKRRRGFSQDRKWQSWEQDATRGLGKHWEELGKQSALQKACSTEATVIKLPSMPERLLWHLWSLPGWSCRDGDSRPWKVKKRYRQEVLYFANVMKDDTVFIASNTKTTVSSFLWK